MQLPTVCREWSKSRSFQSVTRKHPRRRAGRCSRTVGSNSAELAATGEVNMALRSKKPFALMRPLGHHATPTVAMGFCSFELDRDRNRCERDGIWGLRRFTEEIQTQQQDSERWIMKSL